MFVLKKVEFSSCRNCLLYVLNRIIAISAYSVQTIKLILLRSQFIPLGNISCRNRGHKAQVLSPGRPATFVWVRPVSAMQYMLSIKSLANPQKYNE